MTAIKVYPLVIFKYLTKKQIHGMKKTKGQRDKRIIYRKSFYGKFRYVIHSGYLEHLCADPQD